MFHYVEIIKLLKMLKLASFALIVTHCSITSFICSFIMYIFCSSYDVKIPHDYYNSSKIHRRITENWNLDFSRKSTCIARRGQCINHCAAYHLFITLGTISVLFCGIVIGGGFILLFYFCLSSMNLVYSFLRSNLTNITLFYAQVLLLPVIDWYTV